MIRSVPRGTGAWGSDIFAGHILGFASAGVDRRAKLRRRELRDVRRGWPGRRKRVVSDGSVFE